MTNVLAVLALGVFLAVAIVVLTVAEFDRRNRHHRFGIGFRRSHLVGATRPAWRWRLWPLYSPEAIDVLVGTGRLTALHGTARTYLGALYAGTRARRRLEAELDRDRTELVERLRTEIATGSPAIFPPERREG